MAAVQRAMPVVVAAARVVCLRAQQPLQQHHMQLLLVVVVRAHKLLQMVSVVLTLSLTESQLLVVEVVEHPAMAV